MSLIFYDKCYYTIQAPAGYHTIEVLKDSGRKGGLFTMGGQIGVKDNLPKYRAKLTKQTWRTSPIAKRIFCTLKAEPGQRSL